jgi:hypothetical protein
LTSHQRLELRGLYHALFRSHQPFNRAFEEAQAAFTSEHARVLLDFVAKARRGLCTDVGKTSALEGAEDSGA